MRVCVNVQDYGRESRERDFLVEHLKTRPREKRVIRATTGAAPKAAEKAAVAAPAEEKKGKKGKK